jgi:5-methylcytosine-specific restriction endonuclease McrA
MSNIYDEYADTPETAPRFQSAIGARAAAVREFRKGAEYQNAREKYRIRAKAKHNPDGTKGEKCWLCGEPVDYRLKFPHPRSWSLDHAIPIKENPALALNPANWRSAHLDCNEYRGSGEPPIDLGVPSEYW